ncbi:LysR family transcriptional regulator [Litchfieldella qijiaojingensis]|uniref:LysR family transcriptional regulator n=1 Tax=Litchfieldella qijiaojingensis TaxID=980347 RepID=A0ABQ2Z0B2_9GAMM|nr:LysR family transcriptional regulator [Halomonas qijiaojingensis]GGY01070.1 LysR family transcriptional regulator [Halomonas qijiaojingensis]
MNLTQLRALVAVADAGSISQAAERLGVTQSGASQAISSLEESLGVRLVVRGRRGMSLTAVGERAVVKARESLASLEAIRTIADEALGIERGQLTLASFPSVFSTLLPPLLQQFNTQHPGIKVVALEATDEEVDAWLAAGTVDIGVVMRLSPERVGATFYRDEWVAVVPAGHPLSRPAGRVIPLATLVAEPFVLATGGCATHARLIAQQHGLTLDDVRVEVRDWASAFALIREGLGVSLVPELNLPEDRRGLRVLRLETPIHRDLGLEVAPRSAESSIALAFLRMASQVATHPKSPVHNVET